MSPPTGDKPTQPDATRSRLRIDLVCEHFDPNGGHDGQSADLALALARRGHQVRVLAGTSTEAHMPGVELVVRGVRRLRTAAHVWAFPRWASERISDGGADASISTTTMIPADLLVVGDGTIEGYLRALVGQARSPIGRALLRRHGARPALRLRAAIERRTLAHAQVKHIAVDNDLVASQLAALGGFDQGKVCRLPAAVFTPPMSPGRSVFLRSQFDRAFNIDPAAPLFVFPFRSVPLGGMTALLLALKAVAGRGLEPVVLIAGPYRYTHLAWIGQLGLRRRVRFVGQTDRLADLIAAADAVLVPAAYDPAGLGVLAGLAQGRPVVTTRGCGAAERVGGAGAVLEDPTDAAALADAIAALCDPQARAAKSEAASEAADRLHPGPRLGVIQTLLAGRV